MTTSRRVWTAVAVTAGLALLLNLVGLVADRMSDGDVVPGSDGSSYVTTAGGWAAFHDLLVGAGFTVSRLEEPVRPGGLDPSATLVIAAPDMFAIDDGQAAQIKSFVEAGGRLLLTSAALFEDTIGALIDPAPALGAVPDTEMRSLLPIAETTGVETVATSGLYAWDDTGAALPVVGADGASVVAVAAVGEGRVVLLADPMILSNAFLGRADNAALGLAAVGDRPVVFNEFIHGYTTGSAVAAIPGRWGPALLLLAGAIAVWMWAVGSRFAPVEPVDRTFPPSRSLYVDAVAAGIVRTGDDLTTALAAELARTGTPPSSSDPVVLGTRLATLGRRARPTENDVSLSSTAQPTRNPRARRPSD